MLYVSLQAPYLRAAKNKNRLFSSLNVPFYRLEPVCTAASLPPKPHFCSLACFTCHSKPLDNDLPPPLSFPPNEPAGNFPHTHKRPQFLIYRLFSSCPLFHTSYLPSSICLAYAFKLSSSPHSSSLLTSQSPTFSPTSFPPQHPSSPQVSHPLLFHIS